MITDRYAYASTDASSEVGVESSCDEIILLPHEEAECLGALTQNRWQLEGKEHEGKRGKK